MIWQYTPYTIPLIVAASVSVVSAGYIWRHHYCTPAAKTLSLILLVGSGFLLNYTLRLSSVNLSTKVFWFKVELLPVVIVPVAWLVFTLQYTGREKWVTRRSLLVLSGVPVTTLLMIFTNEYHNLYWAQLVLEPEGNLLLLKYFHGPWFWIHSGYSQILVLCGICLLVHMLIRAHQFYRWQITLLLLGVILLQLNSVLSLSGLFPMRFLFATAVLFPTASLAWVLGIFRFRLAEVVPMARKTVIESMSDSVIVLDAENRILDVNPPAQQLMSSAASTVIGKSVEHVWPEWSEQMELSDTAEVVREIVLNSNNEHHTYDMRISPLIGWGGHTMSRVVVLRDITERKRAEEKIKTSLQEKEVLLREVHHRVKNNIQIISSLLRLQMQYIEDKTSIEMIKECQNRIKSMALIHEKLYQSENLANINFGEYIEALVQGLVRSYGVSAARIAAKIEVGDISLDIDTAIPCGLIINELVSNALKHAFPNGRKGEIIVALRSVNEHIELTVSDNGVGIPKDIDFETTDSLGLHLATILAEDQLEGEINLDRSKGTTFQIRFKEQRRKNL